MDLPEAKSLLSRLSQRAPRQAVETILEFLAQEHGAQQAALFVPVDGTGLSLFSARGIDQAAIDWANTSWHRSAKKLQSGLTLKDGNLALVPLFARGKDSLVGVLFLATATINEESIFDVEAQLVAAILRAHSTVVQTPIDEYLVTTDEDSIARRRLLLLCKQFQWNLSMVARHLGRRRQTIYDQLEAFGIQREKVAKGIQ